MIATPSRSTLRSTEKPGRIERPGYSQLTTALLFHFDGFQQLEAEDGFGRDDHVFVAGEVSAASARACAHQSADGRTFAAAGEPADERAQTGTAADHHCRTLAFALGRARDGGGIERIAIAAKAHRFKTQLQFRRALELAQRLRVDHR